MLLRLNIRLLINSLSKRIITFNHRVRWPLKDEKYSKIISENLYKQLQYKKQWISVDSPKALLTKDPYLEIFFSRILQDIANRYQLMTGKTIRARYGINCYGAHIPEMLYDSLYNSIEEPPLEVRTKCRNYVNEAVENYKSAYSKLGLLCDNHYLTTDKDYEGIVAEGFGRLWSQSKIQYDF